MLKQTLIQKILQHRLQCSFSIGEIIEIPVDLVWGSEMSLKFAVDMLRNDGFLTGDYDEKIRKNSKKIMFPFDHLIPGADARSASLMVDLREFAKRYGIRVFEVGYNGGIQHRLFEERGYIYPGSTAIGGDSHSCTYGALTAIGTGVGSSDLVSAIISGKAWLKVPRSTLVKLTGRPREFITGKDIVLHQLGILGVDGATYQSLEYIGEGLKHLAMSDRFTISNMAIECGAKFGLFPSDQTTVDYLFNVVRKNFPDDVRFPEDIPFITGDTEAEYVRTVDLNLTHLEPMVALPYLPSNVLGIHQLHYILNNQSSFQDNDLIAERIKAIFPKIDSAGNIPIQQIFIGSCTNGRIEDLRMAANIMEGKSVAKGVRAIVIPASQQVYRQALSEGLMETFLSAGCYVESSSCGPCIGMKSGVLGKGETAIYTSNRNFYGRTGDISSYVMLASPAVAAASAVAGKLAAPGEFDSYYSSEKELVDSLSTYCDVRETLVSTARQMYFQASVEPYASSDSSEGCHAWCFADDINTDSIMPARYCNVTDPKEYKIYLMLDALNPDFLSHYKAKKYMLDSDAIVAGKNFGCGSSRESAPMGIKTSGVQFVVAHSFARIFFRNAINIGLPIFEIGEAVYDINQGDQLRVVFETSEIINLTQNKVYHAKAMGEFQRKLCHSSGLINYLKHELQDTEGSLCQS